MTSYSPNLGFAEPTPNDPAVSNVWGTILNTNFSLIDSSVAGLLSLSVAGASNVVLTQTNGSADQERNAIFIFTGALTGDVDVLFPASKTKVFTAKNSTTGAHVLSVGVNNGSGSPAGAVAAITQGGSGVYYSDGTNVYNLSISSASPTFTGTVTFPDSATWTSGGINSLTALGIGMVPTNILDITQNQNATSRVSVLNNNSGAAARADVFTSNGTDTCELSQLSSGWTPNGVLRPRFGIVGASTGIAIATGAGPILFGLNSFAEVGRFGTDGSFLVGSTTNAGAGCIGASGNITAYYSDDRLKTRLGDIEDPLGKVMALKGFYYQANDTAKALGYLPVREVGLSAQDVEAVLPEVVAPAPIDHQYKTLHYERIIPLLVEAIKAQQTQIEALKAEIAAK